jgi:SpoVK/Ycf46/Vps4 family AAA+-type ATPase
MKWDLVTLSPSDFIADSLDRIELRAREIFEDLGNLDQCVILLDEMDSLLRDREILAEKSAGTIMEFVVPALLPKLQQLRDYTLDKRMAVFFVSNYYETIDAAILRSGRIDAHLQVLPYGKDARSRVLSSLAERDLTKLDNDEQNELLAYVEKLPCNLVYRDLESLVQTVVAAPRPRNITSILDMIVPTLGISPEIYKPSRRPKAYAEFCAMVARLKNSEPPKPSAFLTREATRDYLEDKKPSIKEYSAWKQMADMWIEKLKETRPTG